MVDFTNSGDYSISLPYPDFPYNVNIKLPFDIARLSGGTYVIYDHGSSYDIRTCNLTYVLSESDTAVLNAFFNTEGAAAGRAVDLTLEMGSDSGFYPFGPDKGNRGAFDVAVEILDQDGVGDFPYLYFRTRMRIVNNGSWPAYSLPAEVDEGQMSFAGITNLRFPRSWFKPSVNYAYNLIIEQDASSQWVDRGSAGDFYETACECVWNESKTAAVIESLVSTNRATSLSLVAADKSFAFGYDKSASGTYTVYMLNDELDLVNESYNRWNVNLMLGFVS